MRPEPAEPSQRPAVATVDPADCRVADLTIPELVAEVYVAAPAEQRGHLLEPLLRPLGILSLCAVAGGVFAKATLRGRWPELQIPLDDIRGVRAADVIALVEYAEQVSVEAVDGLARLLAGMPLLSGSAAAALLVTMLLQRAAQREARTGNQ